MLPEDPEQKMRRVMLMVLMVLFPASCSTSEFHFVTHSLTIFMYP